MQLITELEAIKLLPTFQDFATILGAENWLKMANQLRAEIKGNQFLDQLYAREHRMVFALEHLHNEYAALRHVMPCQHPDLYEACTLVVQFMEILKSHPDSASAFAGRMRGALKNPSDMRAMQFELQVATHLARKGHAISFPELDGTGRFDILAAHHDGSQIEFECKYVTAAKGRAITRHAAIGIHRKIKTAIDRYAQTATAGTVLRIVFHGRAPTSEQEQTALIEPVATALSGGQDNHGQVDTVLTTFDIAESPFASGRPAQEDVATFLQQHGAINTESMTLLYPNGVVVLISLESRRQSRYLESIFDTLSDAARKQLTGERAGVLCAKFDDITAEELIEVGKEADGYPSQLRIGASEFLNSPSSERATMLCFFADGASLVQHDGTTSRIGAVFSFRNDQNRYGDTDLRAIFR